MKITLMFFSFLICFLKNKNKKEKIAIGESLCLRRNLLGPFTKVYAREMQKFLNFFSSRKFMLTKVSAPKVVKPGWTIDSFLEK